MRESNNRMNPLYFLKRSKKDLVKLIYSDDPQVNELTKTIQKKVAEDNKNKIEEKEEEEEEEEEEEDESLKESNNSLSSRKKQAQIEITKLLNLQKWNIFSYARHNKFAEIETLFIEGLNPDSKDQNGNTILIIAAQNDNKRIVKLALRYGAQINMQNSMGNTALHFASEYKYINISNYLIQKGADPNLTNLRGIKAKDGIK